MAVVNASIIRTTLNKDEALNLKDFRSNSLSKTTVIRTRGRPRISSVPSYAKEDMRKDSVGHSLLKQEK
ncbi:hypothetical protein TNCT_457471 [Trichonephila clavata]|uniref:Uncharacterized protein n=1 Tax=Trichonephila clavata TaxID=2740835 RepID=A0A8X6GGY4_TRICU|nr:hypothetical protein TNCT_457471 [Trichonephila clavata]